MIKLRFKDKAREPVWVVEKQFTIGSAENNHLVISSPAVSPVHAKIIAQGEQIFLQDNHSENGSFVNEQRINRMEILPGDCLRFGVTELIVVDASGAGDSENSVNPSQPLANWTLVADASWLSGQAFPIQCSPAIIGRGSQCDIIIPGTHLSRKHAEVRIQGNNLIIRDLGSANGTYINDRRVKEGTAKHGDRIRLDVYSFRLVGPNDNRDSTKVRAPRPRQISPVAKRTPNNDPKAWKTRPTSPGNRIEPTPGAANMLPTIISGLVLLGVFAAIAYYFF